MPSLLQDTEIAHRWAPLAEVRLHYVEAGDGPLVILLHGFPEFWYAWRHQIPALVEAGFRVVAPDMRGYNLSDKPGPVSAYRTEALAADIDQLVRHCGAESAAVAGHDWGAAVAWELAMRHPDVVERLTILNGPHPRTFARNLRSPTQIARLWYMGFFQLTGVAEAALAARDHAVLRRTLATDPTRDDAYTAADIDLYAEAWSQPGAITGALNYYRAAARRNPRSVLAGLRRIEVPVTVIWGERDTALEPAMAQPDPEMVPHARVERIPEASHWVLADRPERVNELLIESLR